MKLVYVLFLLAICLSAFNLLQAEEPRKKRQNPTTSYEVEDFLKETIFQHMLIVAGGVINYERNGELIITVLDNATGDTFTASILLPGTANISDVSREGDILTFVLKMNRDGFIDYSQYELDLYSGAFVENPVFNLNNLSLAALLNITIDTGNLQGIVEEEEETETPDDTIPPASMIFIDVTNKINNP